MLKAKTLITSLILVSLGNGISELSAKGRPTEESVLPLTHTCSNTLKFRAQDMTYQQFVDSCNKVGSEETYFHSKLETNNLPVYGDQNDDLKMVIFDDYNQYNRYGSRIYGISTNNGGIYIEGNAEDPNNQAAFYAHEADWLRPEFVIWNLEHEYVHYLDGRFDLKGNFSDYPSNTVWWAEGLAEYISKQDSNSDAVSLINSNGSNRTLSQVFATTYNNTVEEIYDWGYLGNRFMFENHMQDIRDLRSATRNGDWSTYQNLLSAWGSAYEQEWQDWLVALAGGDSGGGGNGGGTGGDTTLLETIASGAQGSWNYYSVDAVAGTLTVQISGGSGDADLYVKAGSQPSSGDWDCRPYKNGNEESCSLTVSADGTYHIGLYGYSSFSNVSLTAVNTSN
ncbi:collagenase [Aliikangiella sp. G2MR2-5]|uniref:collagenase n=1 Tax=Aliikangiella sp. G2MR2-5 TaxID=2788943 RepID=UPI00273A4546|nr:collagenase [Aliikangiella sp. G2MR2-5]